MDKTIVTLIGIFALALGVGKPAPSAPKSEQPSVGQAIVSYAKRHDVQPKLVHAIISVESNWKVDAKGKAGELGLMQLMPATARAMGVKDRLDPVDNITGGIRYLAYCKQKTGKAYIRCYNAGEKGINSKAAYAYERRVLSKLNG